MAEVKRPDQVLPEHPEYQPIERFWPYADLAEQPTDDELAKLHPELAEALFGARPLPFSISLVFPLFDGARFSQALALARASDEYVETTSGGQTRYRARFYPNDRPERLRDLYDLIADVPDADVLVDDRPVPYARELWLPLVWCLIR